VLTTSDIEIMNIKLTKLHTKSLLESRFAHWLGFKKALIVKRGLKSLYD